MTTRIFRVHSDFNVDRDGSFTETFTIDKSKPNHDGSFDYNIVTYLEYRSFLDCMTRD